MATPELFALSEADSARVRSAVQRCEADLDARGVTVVGALAARLRALATLAEYGRRPRVIVVGRRGAGKSSLLNAVLSRDVAPVGAVEDTTGAARSYRATLEKLEVEWIDTGGLNAGGAAEERAATLRETLLDCPPDTLVFAHAASEADAGIDSELEDVRAAIDAMRATHQRAPLIVCVATRVDELDPPEVTHPPFDDETKRGNIGASLRTLRKALDRHGLRVESDLAINTWHSADADLRWNIDALTHALVRSLAKAAPQPLDEYRILLERVADELAAVVGRLGRNTNEIVRGQLRDWFTQTLRRMGPTAARAGDSAERAASSASLAPGRWLRLGLERVGISGVASAVELGALRALGARVVESLFDR